MCFGGGYVDVGEVGALPPSHLQDVTWHSQKGLKEPMPHASCDNALLWKD